MVKPVSTPLSPAAASALTSAQVTRNPVKGVKRRPVESWQGKRPALGDAQARALLGALEAETLKGKRDRAILSALLYHASGARS